MSERDNPILDILYAEDQDPDWLIPDMMPQGTLVCLAGDSNVGKSYLSYMLSLALACGVRKLGNIAITDKPRRVLYFDEENSPADRDQYLRRCWNGLAFQLGREPDPELVFKNFWPAHFQLGTSNWEEQAAEWIEDIQPHVCIYDTATPAFNLQDENDNAEAQRVMKALRGLMACTDPVHNSIVLRHAKIGKDAAGRRTMRGAKAWRNSSDGVIFHIKGSGRPRKSGLNLTRFERDKVRAYGLTSTIYITPRWTDDKKTGLVLDCSRIADREHRRAERTEE